ncbi:MAG TPA: M48 family metallopeptidase, partial [Burkholderiaceae bacterium]|nr:M48 family metallopeptidase [Burkholderiaceae bacterium]
MRRADFEKLVLRLQAYAQREPRAYQTRVALLAGLGFLILAAIIGVSSLLLLGMVGLVIVTLFSGGKAILLLLKLGKLLLLLAIPLWVLVRSSLQAVFVRFPRPQGREITRAEAPVLFKRLAWMRANMKGPRFHHVLLTDELNAAVVQRPLFGLFGWPRNYLILGLPLLEALSEREAVAVMAHEYGHLTGAHSRFGAFIYRLRLMWSTIGAVAEQWQGWGGRVLGRLIGWYAPYFNAYTFVLARSHEYLADAVSAELVGKSIAAGALKRVNVAAGCYDAFMTDTFARVLSEAEPPRDLVRGWAGRIGTPMPKDLARQYLDTSLARRTDLADTHPALLDRLAALSAPERIDSVPAPLREPSAAQRWFGAGLARLRAELEAQWAQRLRAPWRERHVELGEKRKRLAALEALPAADRDQQWERIALRRELRPQDDHLPALDAYLAKHGDDPVALFTRGVLRLGRDDEGGLTDLEAAMQLDAASTIAACSHAADFLRTRDKVRANAYTERAERRDALEQTRAAEFQSLNVKHVLRPHGVAPALVAQLVEVVRDAGIKHVRALYLVRRELPADPALENWLLGIELSAWARFRSREANVVDAVAALPLPLANVMVCAMSGANRAIGKRIRSV